MFGDAAPFCGVVDEEFDDAEGVDDAEYDALVGRVVVVVVSARGFFSSADGA